jgi:hypothetical protein
LRERLAGGRARLIGRRFVLPVEVTSNTVRERGTSAKR